MAALGSGPCCDPPMLCRTRGHGKAPEVAIELYGARTAAGVPEDQARAAAKAIEEAGRANTRPTAPMWIGGILAGGTIAGFALVPTQLIRLTGDVAGLTARRSRLTAAVAALAEIIRSMARVAEAQRPVTEVSA